LEGDARPHDDQLGVQSLRAKEPVALGGYQTEIGNSVVGQADANFLEPRPFLTPGAKRKTIQKKYKGDRQQTFFAHGRLILSANEALFPLRFYVDSSNGEC
jgi:hypothetical protein